MEKLLDTSKSIHDKALKFSEEDLDIGIDPKISIGPEIEANNDYGICINLEKQSCHDLFYQTNSTTKTVRAVQNSNQ